MSKFKKKFGKRILAFLLSGAMIMSNMTAFASEAPQDTGEEYVREETVVTDENDTEYVEEADADESSKSEDSTADKKDDVKETSAETVEATETSDSKETTETETAKEEQTSETESSLSAETETTDAEETSEEEQTSETDNEEGEADADGFYNGLEATTVEAGKSYYYDFTGHGTIANTYEKGLFSFSAGSYHGAGYDESKPENGIEFKSGNKLTFSVSGNSYIVVGGNNNNTCTELAAAGDKGTMKPETLSTVTAGKAAFSDCKEKGSNTLVYEYTGEAGKVTLTVDPSYTQTEGQTSTKAYIAYVCVIPKEAGGEDEPDTTHTSWKFSDADFQTEANKTSVTAYNGLKIDGGGAKAHNNKYLYVGTNGKVSIPVAGNSVVTVKTQFGDKFYFADKSDDVKEGVTDGTICTYTYEYTGGMGYVTLTVLATTYLTEITVEELEEDETPVNPSTTVSGKNKDGKPDVWDFAGGATKLDENGVPTEYIDTEKYNNVLTEDIINSLYDAEPGKDGVPTSSFAVKNDKDEVLLEFNGGGKLTHRIRTENTKITRYDKSTKTDKDGVKYLGYVYSNASGKDLGPEYKSVYLGIMLEAGDVVTAVVGSNGNNSTIQFEPVDGSEEPQSFEFVPSEKANASIATFYATKTGEYKMYSVNEKLVVARVTVEKKDFVRVSGQVTAPESLTQKYSVSFKCKESGAVKTAKVVDGKYTVYLNEGYTYDVALSGADEYVVSNEQPYFTLSGEGIKEEEIEGVKEKTFTYNVSVEAVDLVTVTGNITGFEAVAGGTAEPIKNLDLIFESDMIYVPKIKINADASFTLTLEKGVTYAVKAEGVDDFTLDTTTISADADGTANIAFTPKPVYNVTIIPEGVTNEELETTKFVFSRVYIEDSVKQYEEDYVYTFTGTNGIKLRDGQYEVKAENCPYTQLITSDLKVEGKDVEKTIRFSKDPITLWDFAAKDFVDVTNYKGLLMSGINKNKTYALGGANGELKIPVAGPCTVTAYYCYRATGSIEDTVEISLKKDVDEAYDSTAKEKGSSYEYTGEAGYVTIKTTDTTYFKKIAVQYESNIVEYKEKLTVGASGCDYTSINDALAAVRNMNRPNGERVTIEIQPGDYEEMLVVDTPNVTLKNANADPSIMPINKGLDIEESSVRITSYYGHGYAYYSMGSDCKWNADILEANKENGCLSFENPGTGTTSGSYWNATVVIGADGFEADGIIFENSFNQYVSKKAADDVIIPLSGAKEGSAPRADMKAGDLTVQNKEYVERAAALAIMNNFKNINFNNCSFIGRQDTLYGGVEVRAAFYGCDVYGGTDYIFGGMDAVFAKCNLVFNTNDQTDKGKKDDVGYITAAQTASGRGLLLYNCTVTSTIPGVNTASEKTSKPGYLGRPWAANTGEAIFYKTIIETTDFNGTTESLIVPVGWASSLGGQSVFSQEYASIELAGVDYSSQRADWSSVLTADAEGKVKLADGNTVVTDDTVVAAFLGDWNPFAGKDMTIVTSVVEAPTADKDSGNVPQGTKITLTCVEGAEIYYTIDGSNPTTESAKYTEPISLGDDLRTVTIKAIAVKEGKKSKTAVFEYTVVDAASFISAPESSIPTGTTVEPGTAVTLTCATEGAEIFYTTDGTDPTAESNKYTGEIIIADTMTIKAIAIMGENKSEISTFEYAVSSDKPIVVTTININDCEIAVSSILADSKKNPDNMPKTSVVYYVGKDRKGIPVRFAEGLDYKVSKPVLKEGNLYAVTLTGLGRSVDEYRIDPDSSCEMTFRVFDKKADKNSIIDLSKAKITLDGTQKGAIYTGKAFTPEVTEVKVGKDVIDMSKYKVSYKSNVNAGKASVIVSADSKAMYGEGEKFVIGTKAVTFTIKKAALNKADQITVTALDKDGKDFTNGSFPYRGIDVVEIDDLSVKTTSGQKNLREGIDYTVTYKNNRKVGKASAVIKGIGNNVSGSYTVPFKIEALNIGVDSQYKLRLVEGVSLQYTPNGAKLGLVCAYNEDDRIYLEEGIDFKVTYKYFDKSKAPGTDVDFTAKGINACTGYFSNKVNGEGNSFKIEKTSLGESFYLKADVIVDAAKATDSNKLQKAVEKALVLVDPYDGKLKVKKDYTVEVNEKDKKVLIRPAEKSYYLDADYVEDPYLQTDYTLATNIKTVKPDKKYTVSYDGRNPVQLDKDDISKLLGGLKLNEDVVIVKGSYKNNYKAGTASVTVQGIGNYYGTVTIKFKIIEA